MPAKKTHAEFLSQLDKLWGGQLPYEVLGRYAGGGKRLLCRCKGCSHEWQPTPNNLLSVPENLPSKRRACPKCKREKLAAIQRKSHDKFVEELSDFYNGSVPFVLLEKYGKNNKDGIECLCLGCGQKKKRTPSDLLSGRGCKKCAGLEKKSNSEFLDDLSKIYPEGIPYEILGEYKNSKTRIPCLCKRCQHPWSPIPNSMLSGKGCIICGGKAQKTNSQFLLELSDVWRGQVPFDVLDEYSRADRKVKCRCHICGHPWSAKPVALLYGHSCDKCGHKRAGDKLRHTHDQFMTKLEKVWNGDIPFDLLGQYQGETLPLLCQCIECGDVRPRAPSSLLGKHDCKFCSSRASAKKQRKSHEQFLSELVELWDGDVPFSVLEEYVTAFTPLSCKCNTCSHEWPGIPNRLLSGNGCGECGQKFNPILQDLWNWPEVERSRNTKLYIVSVTGESEHFWKVGFTTQQLKTRFRSIRKKSQGANGNEGYDISTVDCFTSRKDCVILLENLVHRRLEKYRYCPAFPFDGRTECFSVIPISVMKVEEIEMILSGCEQLMSGPITLGDSLTWEHIEELKLSDRIAILEDGRIQLRNEQ